ncbi:MAG: 30S ribosomal protein S4 [Candidatus Omnitrophica bacterium]|nr:30S ribosomal protein S4 [Candidatus Omnitrophota bacterium]
MARYTGSSCRLCRAEGEKLFLKGYRCNTDKCAIARRQYGPGQHGPTARRKKLSNYATQMRMKQKVKRMYGLMEKQFRSYFKAADKAKGITGEILLQFLERRLDNVVFRTNFSETRAKSRQIVRHRFVSVNGHKVDIPSYLIKEGDEITFSGTDNQKKAFREVFKSLEERDIPGWLDVDGEALALKIKRLPVKDDIGVQIEENLIVELYSK